MRRLVLALAVAAVTAAAGCGDDDEPASTARLPAGCESTARPQDQDAPAGLHKPDGAVLITSTRKAGEQTVVEGFAGRTPSQAVDDLAGQDGVKVLEQEDEGEDAEITLSDGENRTAYKFVKACEDGSRFSAVIVAEP